MLFFVDVEYVENQGLMIASEHVESLVPDVKKSENVKMTFFVKCNIEKPFTVQRHR